MELSLDEIIKKNKPEHGGGGVKKKFFNAAGKAPLRKILNKPVFKETRNIADARTKIIQKNRAKIIDAREKLLEVTKIKGDARRLIENRRTAANGGGSSMHRNGAIHSNNNNYRNNRVHHQLPPSRVRGVYAVAVREPKPHVVPPHYARQTRLPGAPRGYVDYDNMEQYEAEEYVRAAGLSRTVRNDVRHEANSRMDYSPERSGSLPPPAPRRLNSWNSQASDHYDPFDIYERHERRRTPPAELPPPPPKGILRSSRASPELYERRYIPDTPSHLSYEMRSRLENVPDPHLSAGIFANHARGTAAHHSSSGYRIVVSNLHPSVTQSDIRELFEDIGPLYDSRIVRPGVAEVIYKSLNDAEKAVDTYHNRQLDRQPMKCLLVNPRASDKPTAPAIHTSSSSNSRLASGKTPLEIDIDALHKVLFRRH